MDALSQSRGGTGEAPYPRAHRLVRRLTWLYGICALAYALLLAPALLPAGMLGALRAYALEQATGGLAGMVLAALLLALTGLTATLVLTRARAHYASAAGEFGPAGSPDKAWHRWLRTPGAAARQGQALIVPLGAVLIWAFARLLWPSAGRVAVSTDANIGAALVFGLAFISLIGERLTAAFPEPQLPEAPSLRRILLLSTLLLAAAACIELGRAVGLGWVRWADWVLACVPGVVALELALRALARLFLPAPQPAQARAATDSLLVGMLSRRPRSPGTLLRKHLGLDFARSWALAFLSAAALPALLVTLFVVWGLSGLKLIESGQRGVYERFGAPIAVLGPGLHLLVPWPFGRLIPVEFGTIHSVPIGLGRAMAPKQVQIGAEATPPPSLYRLWERAQPDEATYLVPSTGTSKQSFQSVSTEIYVLYRVGLTNRAALESVYAVGDPASLIQETASRLVLSYFNSRTLEQVIGTQPEDVERKLRTELQREIDTYHSGIDIVSVLIGDITPPSGAAAAYHAVQAAEIQASASIADAKARAERIGGVAAQQAHEMTTAAAARAVEIVDSARASAYSFAEDQRAYEEGARSFLRERRYGELVRALKHAPLIIVDSRLSPTQGPIFDMLPQSTSQASAGSGGNGGVGQEQSLSGAAGRLERQDESYFWEEGAAPPSQQTQRVQREVPQAIQRDSRGFASSGSGGGG